MIQIENVTFSYGENGGHVSGIKNLSLHIAEGECVVLCGESGCGKTTVTRLVNGLIPHYYEGTLTGTVRVGGQNVAEQPLYETARMVGSVFQNPRTQFFNVDTDSELVFGCENAGMSEDDIREKLQETVREFHLEKLMNRSIFELSGGEKQKIACVSAAMTEPGIIVLDEPSSNLDALSVRELHRILARWKKQGKTILISEHRLYYLKDIANRFIYLKEGKIYRDYTAEEFAELGSEERKSMGLRAFTLKNIQPIPYPLRQKEEIKLNDFYFSYKGGKEALHIGSCTIPARRIVGIIGNNGAGKSTFSRCLCGLEKNCGELVWKERKYRAKDRINICYMVMQDVNHQLFTESVIDEVLISMENEDSNLAEQVLEKLNLTEYKGSHPLSLSGGQKQRVAIATAIASERKIMIFDEPTSGLDYKHMQKVAAMFRKLCDNGISLYIVTHDAELLAECCTDIISMADGEIREQYTLDMENIGKVREYFGSM